MVNVFFQTILNQKLTPNQFYVLYSIYDKISPREVNLHQELRFLESNGWLDNNKLTLKSVNLIKEVDRFFISVKAKSDREILGDEWEKRIMQYLEIFPKMMLPNGKAARSDKKVVEDNFKWFFQNYKYSWEDIIEATLRYVNFYQSKNYKFMRTAQFFIRKQVVGRDFNSDLAEWCNNKDMKEESNPFIEKIT